MCVSNVGWRVVENEVGGGKHIFAELWGVWGGGGGAQTRGLFANNSIDSWIQVSN